MKENRRLRHLACATAQVAFKTHFEIKMERSEFNTTRSKSKQFAFFDALTFDAEQPQSCSYGGGFVGFYFLGDTAYIKYVESVDASVQSRWVRSLGDGSADKAKRCIENCIKRSKAIADKEGCEYGQEAEWRAYWLAAQTMLSKLPEAEVPEAQRDVKDERWSGLFYEEEYPRH